MVHKGHKRHGEKLTKYYHDAILLFQCPLSQSRTSSRSLLPVLIKLGVYVFMPDFKWQSLVDNFHNPVIRLTNLTFFDIKISLSKKHRVSKISQKGGNVT
jgi:hypothetical protein